MPHDSLILTKHHGLGNDFLVLLDPDDRFADLDPAKAAIALCHRTTGIGADGFIRLGPELRMHLHNADGSRAEMSGNGIRCLAQAIVDAGLAGTGSGGTAFEILTDAGARGITVVDRARFTVDMGPAKVVDLEERRAEVDTGNPHLVLLVDDPWAEQLEDLGRENAGVNVEVVRVDDRETVTMRVHERGAGITQACGTGSCAIAAATLAWGLTGERVTVRNPGGDLEVELQGEVALLTGPAVRIASIDVEVRDAWR